MNIGSDKDLHDICTSISSKIKIVIHPPNCNKFRAYCDSNYILEEKPYLKRNHNIVNSCDILIACPPCPEVLRSGTWARKNNKKIILN